MAIANITIVGVATTDADITSIIGEALDFLQRHPEIQVDMLRHFTILTAYDYFKPPAVCNPFPHQPLLITFVDIHSLCKPIGSDELQIDNQEQRVIAPSEATVFGRFRAMTPGIPALQMYEIQLCYGLQRDTLISVLAHEMLHAVFTLQSKWDISPMKQQNVCLLFQKSP